jgi:hypothetical protein
VTRLSAERLRARLENALADRLSPERTRRPTRLERLTVQRLSWEQVVRLNRYLELFGKLTTVIWVVFVGTVVLGVDWKDLVEDAVNSGKPVKGAFVLAIVLPTLLFVAAHSIIGFARWRLQRELWRRDVERARPR